MTIQEKKQVLAQYQTTKREIIRLTKERDDWNDLAYRISANYSDTVVSGGCKVDKIQTSIEQMDRITQLICDRIEQLVLLKQQIEEAIQGIDDQVRIPLHQRFHLGTGGGGNQLRLPPYHTAPSESARSHRMSLRPCDTITI